MVYMVCVSADTDCVSLDVHSLTDPHATSGPVCAPLVNGQVNDPPPVSPLNATKIGFYVFCCRTTRTMGFRLRDLRCRDSGPSESGVSSTECLRTMQKYLFQVNKN